MEKRLPKGTILYVEDNPKMTDIFADYIEKDLNYLVVRCINGYEALERMDEGLMLGLAMVDISLPDMSGEDLIKKIKEKDRELPVVSMSAWHYMPKNATAHFDKRTPYTELASIIPRLYRHGSK